MNDGTAPAPAAWRVVYRDDEVVAVAKPPGMVVVPGRGDVDAGGVLRAEVEQALGVPLWVVHRIDRPASGLVLFASSARAHRSLSMAFEAGTVRRTYLAWVLGVPEPLEGAIDLPIREGRKGRMKVAADGRPSRTDYRVLRAGVGAALVEARLGSGRRHQIRLHFAWRGHPVLFDEPYAGPRLSALRELRDRRGTDAAEPGIRLHAWQLEWTGQEGQPHVVTCEPPEGFDPF